MDNIAGLGSALAAMRPSGRRYDGQLMRSALPSAPLDERLPLLEQALLWLRDRKRRPARSV